MKRAEVMELLESEKDERGIAHWEEHEQASGGLSSYGIGLTKLRKLAKQVGRDPELARELWRSKVYDARVIALLIDDPKQITIDQAERQVEQLQGGYLAHVFSSCDATLAKAPFVRELLDRWIVSEDETRRRCGYGLLYEVSKSKKKSAPTEAEFLDYVRHIGDHWKGEDVDVLMAMGAALMGIGMRSVRLHQAALRIARKIGPIHFDERGKCDPFDVEKRLINELVLSRLGIEA